MTTEQPRTNPACLSHGADSSHSSSYILVSLSSDWAISEQGSEMFLVDQDYLVTTVTPIIVGI